MRCGTIRRTLCANKRPNCSRHVAQEAQCARPRCAKAPSRRTGHGGRPRLANVARARESGLQAGSAPPKSGLRGLPRLSKHDHLILKCPKTHDAIRGAIRAGAQICVIRRYGGLGKVRRRIVIKQSNAADTNQTIKIPRIPLSHPTRFQNQNNQNSEKIPVNRKHWVYLD